MIVDWFKKIAGNIAQKHKLSLIEIEKAFAFENDSSNSVTINFEEELSKIFTEGKEGWRIKSMENSVFNRLVKNLILKMAQDSKLKNTVYNTILHEKTGKQVSLFYLLMSSSHKLNKKTKDYVLRAFPLKCYFQLYLRNPENNTHITPLRVLMKTSAGDFFKDVCDYYGIDKIFDASKTWSTDGVNISRFMDEFSDMVMSAHQENSKTQKLNQPKIDYVIDTITKDSLSLVNSTLQNEKSIFLGIIGSIEPDYIEKLMLRNFVEKNDIINIAPSLLSKYEESTSAKNQDFIKKLIKNIFDNFDANLQVKIMSLVAAKQLTQKTYDMWIKELANNSYEYETVHGVLIAIFFNSEKSPDMKLFNYYLNEIVNINQEDKDKINFDFYVALCNRNASIIFSENMETYLDYFYYNCNYDLNDFVKNSNDEVMSLPTFALINGAEFTTEQVKLLKEYNFDPFAKYSNFSSFYEAADVKIKNDIADVYIKEMAEFEKEKIISTISDDGQSANETIEIKTRKRL